MQIAQFVCLLYIIMYNNLPCDKELSKTFVIFVAQTKDNNQIN